MNWADQRAAFELRLSGSYTATPVQYPGVTHSPTNAAWVKMALLPGDSKRISLGSNGLFREYGSLVLMIFTPAGQGTNAGRTLADLLFPIFREAIFSHGSSGMIHCKVPCLDDVGPTPDGVWHQLNLVVDYHRDLTYA